MIHFLPGDQRRRHKFIDRTIDNYSDILTRSEMNPISRLLPSTISDHRAIMESLAVPNLRHGVLYMGKEALQSEIYLPVYALHQGESVVFDVESSTQHPMQREETDRFFEDRNAYIGSVGSSIRKFFADKNKFGPAPGALAFVENRTLISKQPDTDPITICGRPHTFFHMEDSYGTRFSLSSPDVVCHEFTHVIQKLISPARSMRTRGDVDDDSLRDELEAYHLQESFMAQMVQENYIHRNEPVTYELDDEYISSDVIAINQLRNWYNRDREDKFFPDLALRNELSRIGIKVMMANVEDSSRHEEI